MKCCFPMAGKCRNSSCEAVLLFIVCNYAMLSDILTCDFPVFCTALHNLYYLTHSLISSKTSKWQFIIKGGFKWFLRGWAKLKWQRWPSFNLPECVMPSVVPGTCVKCTKEVYGANQACQAMGNLYHDNCFTCSACSKHTHRPTPLPKFLNFAP